MKSRASVGVLTRPINIGTCEINVANANAGTTPGSLSQTYDSIAGTYFPDRTIVSTRLSLLVTYSDPQGTGVTEEVDFAEDGTVQWYFDGTEVTSLNGDGRRRLSGVELEILYNLPTSTMSVPIRAVGTFYDATGAPHRVDAEASLQLIIASATSLTLRRVTTKETTSGGKTTEVADGTKAGEVTVVNLPKMLPMTSRNYDETNEAYPYRFERPEEWRRECAVQLCDGEVPIPDGWNSGDTDTPSGTAFYLWYGDGTLLTGDEPYIQMEPYADGTHPKSIIVDMRFRERVKLECRAYFIPYGEHDDYMTQDGTIDMTKLGGLQVRRLTYRLHVKWPSLRDVECASMAHERIDRADLGSSTVDIKRQALLSTDEGAVPVGGGIASRMFSLQWTARLGSGTPVVLSNDEQLQTTPKAIAQALGISGAKLDANNMPVVELSADRRSSYAAIPDYELDNGVIRTNIPEPGDVLYLDGNGEKVWIKNGDDQLHAENIPADWTLVGYVFHRGKTDIVSGEADNETLVGVLNKTGTDEKYLDVAMYAWTDVELDGAQHTKTMTLNITTPGGEAASTRDTVNVTYEATTLAQAAAAVQTAIEAIARAADTAAGRTTDKYVDLWHAYADEANGRVIIQCDELQSYRQTTQYSGVTFISYEGTTANSTSGIRQDGTAGGILNAARGTTYYAANGTNDNTLGLTGSIMRRTNFDNSTNADVIAYKAQGGTYESYIREYKMLTLPQPRRQGCFTLPLAAEMSKAVAMKTAPTKDGGEKYIFPALHATYSVGYNATGLEQGRWHLPGVQDALYLMRDTDDGDDAFTKVAASARKTGGTSIINSTTRWLAQRSNVTNAWFFYGNYGNLNYANVASSCRSQAVTLVRL